jgi:hypothetical protein
MRYVHDGHADPLHWLSPPLHPTTERRHHLLDALSREGVAAIAT